MEFVLPFRLCSWKSPTDFFHVDIIGLWEPLVAAQNIFLLD